MITICTDQRKKLHARDPDVQYVIIVVLLEKSASAFMRLVHSSSSVR